MSELAGEYYKRRGMQIASPVPHLLNGAPVPILQAEANPSPVQFASDFFTAVQDVEPFILAGVRCVNERVMPDDEWEKIKASDPFVHTSSAISHAHDRMAPYLVKPNSQIFLEALADREIPPSTLKKAVNNKPIIRTPGQEMARVVLLARTVKADSEVAAAYLTIMWGEHKVVNEIRRTSTYLTPRYYGAPVVDREVSSLPPLER